MDTWVWGAEVVLAEFGWVVPIIVILLLVAIGGGLFMEGLLRAIWWRMGREARKKEEHVRVMRSMLRDFGHSYDDLRLDTQRLCVVEERKRA